MSTNSLVERILAADDDVPASVADAVHELSDESSIDASAAPRSVAEAAALVGLSPHTLRYYEQERLVCPSRNRSGYRQYTQADLRRLVFLTRMRLSGMTIQDLKRYIALVEQDASTIPERRRIMLEQRDRIRRQLRDLTLALETTEYKIRAYDGHPEG
jgi:DNA-binding transcriptional MerR regulator